MTMIVRRQENFVSLAQLVAAMLIVLMSALVAGAAAPSDDTAAVRIVAEDLPGPTGGDVSAVAARKVLKTFLDENPAIRVDPFSMPAIEGSSMDNGPLMAIAAGIPPNVMYVNFRQSSTYLAQGFLDPLEILLARIRSSDERVRQTDAHGKWLADPTPQEIAATLADIRSRVPKPAWPVVYRKDEETKESHVYALPLAAQVMALLYRKDVFAEAGLDPEKPPTTWDELIDVSRKLTVPSKQQFGFMISGGGQYISWAVYNFLASNGAEAMREDANGNWRAAYGTRDAAEAVYFVWRMRNETFTPGKGEKPTNTCAYISTGVDGNNKWNRGEIAMQFQSIKEDLIATFDPEVIGIAPVPKSPRGTFAGQVNARSYGVFSQSSPQQKLAAARYIWFVTGDEGKRIRTEVYVKNGFGKFMSPDLLEKFGYDWLLKQVSKSWQDTFKKSMETGVPEPYGKNTQNIYRWMSEPINTALDDQSIGQMPRDKAIDKIEGLMKASAQRVNEEVLGDLPASTMRTRRLVAIPVLILMTLAFTAGLVHVWRSFARASAEYASKGAWRRHIFAYLLLVPAMMLMFWWAYVPLGMGLSISFVDFQLVRQSLWVGIDNFANVLFDDKFWYPLVRTFYFVALTIGLGFWPPILLAILLQEIPTATAKYIYRTIFYLPAVVSGLVVTFLWRQMYDPSENGILNQLLMSFNVLGPFSATVVKWIAIAVWLLLIYFLLVLPFKVEEMAMPLKIALIAVGIALLAATIKTLFGGDQTISQSLHALIGRFDIKALKWKDDPALAMLCVVIPSVWAASGPGCILYLAALKNVPDEFYEAADIDGATNWHKVFYIVLPSLKYLIVVQFIGAVIGAFKGGVESIMVMTGGGPNNATSILALEIFNRVFLDLKFGIGTAMAWMLGALLIGFTAYQLKMLSRAEFKAAGSPK